MSIVNDTLPQKRLGDINNFPNGKNSLPME